MARRKSHKRKSTTARARKSTKRRARRASRKSMPAGLKAYWAKKATRNPKMPGGVFTRSITAKEAAVLAKVAKPRRTGKKSKAKAHKAKSKKRKSRMVGNRHKQGDHEWHHGKLVNPRKRRHSRRRRNPGAVSSMSFMGGIKGFLGNVKDTFMGGGVKGFAVAAAGAGGAVIAGTIVDRLTRPIVAQFAPSLLQNSMFSRVLGGANYYIAGWALAKYVPGISPRTRRAVLTGASVAALMEVIKPGMVRGLASRVPVVGGLFGYSLEGVADGVSDYVAFTLNGLSGDSRATAGGGYLQQEGMADYALAGDDTALADYSISGDDGMAGH